MPATCVNTKPKAYNAASIIPIFPLYLYPFIMRYPQVARIHKRLSPRYANKWIPVAVSLKGNTWNLWLPLIDVWINRLTPVTKKDEKMIPAELGIDFMSKITLVKLT